MDFFDFNIFIFTGYIMSFRLLLIYEKMSLRDYFYFLFVCRISS
jgi:hypothetical protein